MEMCNVSVWLHFWSSDKILWTSSAEQTGKSKGFSFATVLSHTSNISLHIVLHIVNIQHKTTAPTNTWLTAWLTGVLPSDRVNMLIDMLILSEEERDGGEGLLFSTSCRCRKSRQARWILHVKDKERFIWTVTHWKLQRGKQAQKCSNLMNAMMEINIIVVIHKKWSTLLNVFLMTAIKTKVCKWPFFRQIKEILTSTPCSQLVAGWHWCCCLGS